MNEDKRPSWPHKTPEEIARWFWRNRVIKIEHHWEMTSPDTSIEWILCFNRDGETLKLPTDFFTDNSEIKFQPDHAGLVRLGGYPDIYRTLQAIDAWEAKNAKEREEYERLKRKFSGDCE